MTETRAILSGDDEDCLHKIVRGSALEAVLARNFECKCEYAQTEPTVSPASP
jgi:hypothetical protein